jgi:hypothetical protein
MNKQLISAVLISVVLAGGAGYWLGQKTGGSKTIATNGNATNYSGARPGATGTRSANSNFNRQGNLLVGEVLKIDDQSLTIKLRDGGTKIAFFTASTTVGKFTAGAKTDLALGQNITITGAANPDGSVAANMVQIRPAGETVPGAMNDGTKQRANNATNRGGQNNTGNQAGANQGPNMPPPGF